MRDATTDAVTDTDRRQRAADAAYRMSNVECRMSNVECRMSKGENGEVPDERSPAHCVGAGAA
ncbi:hypothetical protein [Burkholderia anthina]|uniref:hypothetical protein n=1 Tax=Burkholderia anthina TaxID=179879 RepID=UPI00158CE270|nr:hypothetical protein [Burkholderia anthina]